ncbi:MAG: transcription elongation factor GreA [Acidobacteria bacterium]|nr:transcription elongation factor GreA [Acidobacteriota bacterium]
MKDVRKKLEVEIRALEMELKAELPKAIQTAREMGDLRENAEYQTAKERQRFVQAKISHLRERLAKLSMVNLKNIPEGKVAYGSTVVLRDTGSDREVTYKLVSSEESDVAGGLISINSPIGRSLIGHCEGDEVEIHTPGGKKTYEILRLTTVHQEMEEA